MTPSEDSQDIPPVIDPELAAQHPDLKNQDVPCLNCGYNLRGLQEEGRCPECGTPVERSLKGNLLLYSSPEHLKSLHTGVFLILAGIILQILCVLGSILLQVALSFGSGGSSLIGVVQAMLPFIFLGISLFVMYGWWLFSTPDPAILGNNTGSKARQMVRTIISISLILAMSKVILEYVLPASGSTGIILIAANVTEYIAILVMFFAEMVYIRWLAPRLQDERVFKRSKLLMWLVPVLVLLSLCTIYISMLIALVLYWNLLDWVRCDLKEIRKFRSLEFDADAET